MELQSNGQYYIEIDDILNNSEITQVDLDDLYEESLEWQLKNASQKTYNILYSAAPNVYRNRQRLALNYMIQQDSDLQTLMRDAIIEYIRGALYSGMDLREYDKGGATHSQSLIDMFKENGLWIVAEIEYRDEDIE